MADTGAGITLPRKANSSEQFVSVVKYISSLYTGMLYDPITYMYEPSISPIDQPHHDQTLAQVLSHPLVMR